MNNYLDDILGSEDLNTLNVETNDADMRRIVDLANKQINLEQEVVEDKPKPKAKSKAKPRPPAKVEPEKVEEMNDADDVLPDDDSVFEVTDDFLPDESE